MCRYIVASMFSDEESTTNKSISYASIALDKNYTVIFIRQMKNILLRCSSLIARLKSENTSDFKCILLFLNMMVTFTSTSSWPVSIFKQEFSNNLALKTVMNQLCSNILDSLVAKNFYKNLQSLLTKGLSKNIPSLNKPALTAVITLALRPILISDFSPHFIENFIAHILSVPGLIHHLEYLSPNTIQVLREHRIFQFCINFLSDDQSSNLFESFEANHALCLLGNVVNFCFLDQDTIKECFVDFVVSIYFGQILTTKYYISFLIER